MRHQSNRSQEGSDWTTLDTLLFLAAFNLTAWTFIRVAASRLASLM